MRRVVAQARVELMLTLRNGENLLATVAIPVGVLVFFTLVDVLPRGTARAVDVLVPAALTLAIVSTAMVTLSIGTAFERQNGMLKRLGVTPLGRDGLLAAKIASVLVVVATQSVVLGAIGAVLGWRPDAWAPAVAVLVLGVAAFASIGFLLAGTLRAEATLAASNGLFLVFMLLGGTIVPASELPDALRALARVLPAEPLATGLRHAFAGASIGAARLAVLAAWTLVAAGAAIASFRWDER